jgi:hypothetical protein
MLLEGDKTLRAEQIEQIKRQDVKRIRHGLLPKQEYPVADS